MFFDDLGSTSWHHRHHAVFARLNALLVDAGVREASVLIVGPGAVTRIASPWLNDASRDVSRGRKLVGDLARYADQLLRRIPAIPLRSLEPVELSRALSMPHRLFVVDRSPRSIAAVCRDLPGTVGKVVDITATPIAVRADIVVAMNVISRLGDHAAAGVRNVLSALDGGGWLVMDDRSARQHVQGNPRATSVAPKTYRIAPAGGADDDRSSAGGAAQCSESR